MILVDLNQVLLSGLMEQFSTQKNLQYEEDLIRHIVLNTLRSKIKPFKSEYGEVVLCYDNMKYWRKEYFPFYKHNRKKMREQSKFDWTSIFKILDKIKIELKEYFPYKSLDIEGAEADDIIGTLTCVFANSEKILILSSDGDFLQLQRWGKNVNQYNPVTKKFIKCDNPVHLLKEKIICGDKGDGIPNIFSPSDCFVRGVRQKSITEVKLQQLLGDSPENWSDDTAKSGYERNSVLIDLRMTPMHIKKLIIDTYDSTKPNQGKLFNYFIEKKLFNLMDYIEDF